MKDYVNSAALQEYTTKLVAKLKTLFPGTPTAAATVADMTDHSKTYVYVGSESGYTAGDWYYWDGSAWTSGGPFQATSIITDTTLAVAGEAADAKATGDAIAAAKTAVLNAMAPAYSTSATYAVGDYVNYNGGIYRCTTAITTAESWTSGHWTAVTLGADLESQVSDLKTQITIQDDRTNHLFGLMNYGYDTPADLPQGSTASKYISVKRDGTRVLLDGSTVSAQWIGKLNNDVQRAASSTTVKALTNGTVFTSGHTFRVISKKISGTGTYNNNDYIPEVVVYKEGTSTTVGSIITQTSNEYCREFTADGSEYMICLRCENGGGFTNMLVEVTMQDMADESVYELIASMDNTVPEGTAWN